MSLAAPQLAQQTIDTQSAPSGGLDFVPPPKPIRPPSSEMVSSIETPPPVAKPNEALPKLDTGNLAPTPKLSGELKMEDWGEDGPPEKVEVKTAAPVATPPHKVASEERLVVATPVQQELPIPALAPAKKSETAAPINDGRDYSIFTEEEQKFVRNTSNEAFEYFKKKLPEYREQVAKSSENNLFSHPQAFIFTPEFQRINEELQFVQYEEQHYDAMLERLRAGDKEVFRLKGFQGSEPQFEKLTVTPENIAKLEREFTRNHLTVNQHRQQYQGQLSMLQQSHTHRYSQAVNVLREAEKKFLPSYEDPKHPRMAQIEAFRTQHVPAEFRNIPVSRTMSKMYGAMLDMGDMIKELQGENAKLKQLGTERREAGPSAEATSGGGSGGASQQTNKLSMAEWKTDNY